MHAFASHSADDGACQPDISVVIPTLNEAENIRAAVASACTGSRSADFEILIADGGSSDGTLQALPAEIRVVRAARGRAKQMNAGAQASRGDILLFLHADTCLPEGWAEAVQRALSRPEPVGGVFQIRVLPARGILHLINRLWLPANWRLMYGDQAMFVRRGAFEQAGGFPDLPLMEDLELARRLHRIGRLVRLPLRVTSSSRRFLECGPLRMFLLDVRLVLWYLYLGGKPDELARLYRSSRETG